ncbi:MAG TPA: ribonuclease P protein subunit [Nitrosopumilaceae archaeon]|nr:ribonuclease P protein subunit [Nitrosopumilaceae archaeon]
MITPENIMMHELIGLHTTIVESNNSGITGMTGKVIDETKSMIILDTEKGIKKIAKENTQWKFSLGTVETLVSGNMLTKRPQERIGGRHG